jgi:homoserine dehydrogenase
MKGSGDGSGFRVQGSANAGESSASLLSASSSSSLNPELRTLNPSTDRISLRVHPTLVHKDDLLAQVSGSFNAISVYGHALGHALFYGRGAGRMPTASAVVSDVLAIGLGTVGLMFKQLDIFPDATPPANVLPFDKLQSRYYLRLTARDQPGVLAAVTRVLGDHAISLASFLQHESPSPASAGSPNVPGTKSGAAQPVPLVLTTHTAKEGAVQAALKQIDALPDIIAPSVCLRIIDQPKEFAGG